MNKRLCVLDLWRSETLHTTSAERFSLVVSIVGLSLLLLVSILGLVYQSGGLPL